MRYYRIKIEPGDKPTIFDSKIGGVAYWTSDKNYPVGANGKPLFLLAQINFERFNFEPPLPNVGMLQFFISDDDLMGADYENPTAQKNFRVIYHERIDYQTRDELKLPHNEQAECLPVYGEFKISFSKETGDGSEHNPPYHQIFGRPFFTQDDPRSDDSEFDTLLLQIDSEGEYVLWGDMGVGNFFIRRQDLIDKNFSDVLYNWDCC